MLNEILWPECFLPGITVMIDGHQAWLNGLTKAAKE